MFRNVLRKEKQSGQEFFELVFIVAIFVCIGGLIISVANAKQKQEKAKTESVTDEFAEKDDFGTSSKTEDKTEEKRERSGQKFNASQELSELRQEVKQLASKVETLSKELKLVSGELEEWKKIKSSTSHLKSRF
tara:strand:+ start:156 stop:557 length:402 start_codon:yes stop_codon:yes gene_type:complete